LPSNPFEKLLSKRIDMAQQDLYVGLGNLAYAVAKADGELHKEEEQVLAAILRKQDHGDIAFLAFKIKARMNSSPEEAYQFAFRRFSANIKEFSRRQKEQFFHILDQVVKASQGICAEESMLLKRIRVDLGRLTLFSREFQKAV
jgi:uncharacterized tellurite resistance protein B-like protein